MKTSDLIASLAADSRAPTLPLKRRLAVALIEPAQGAIA